MKTDGPDDDIPPRYTIHVGPTDRDPSTTTIAADFRAEAMFIGRGERIARAKITMTMDADDKPQFLIHLPGQSSDGVSVVLRADCGHVRDLHLVPKIDRNADDKTINLLDVKDP